MGEAEDIAHMRRMLGRLLTHTSPGPGRSLHLAFAFGRDGGPGPAPAGRTGRPLAAVAPA